MRHTRVDTDGCCRPWTFHKNGSAQKKQWLYSGDTKVFVIRIMLISLFSPGARQSFFSTITQSAGHHSVYLHCVWKVHTLKSFEVTGDIDGSRSQDSWLPKNHQVYPGLPWRIHWKGVISVVREAVLSVPRRPRRPPRPGDPRLSPLARTEWRWQGATAVVAVLKSFQQQSQIGAVVWSSIRHLMIFFIDVLLCQVQQVQWISELQIGAPDFNGC